MTAFSYAMVFVSDMTRAIRFYRDALGLRLKFESPGWTEFLTGETTLALHLADAANAEPVQDHLPSGRCRLGFGVENLDEFHHAMLGQGVPCLQPPRMQFGARIAVYADPDGLAFSVGEAPSAVKP